MAWRTYGPCMASYRTTGAPPFSTSVDLASGSGAKSCSRLTVTRRDMPDRGVAVDIMDTPDCACDSCACDARRDMGADEGTLVGREDGSELGSEGMGDVLDAVLLPAVAATLDTTGMPPCMRCCAANLEAAERAAVVAEGAGVWLGATGPSSSPLSASPSPPAAPPAAAAAFCAFFLARFLAALLMPPASPSSAAAAAGAEEEAGSGAMALEAAAPADAAAAAAPSPSAPPSAAAPPALLDFFFFFFFFLLPPPSASPAPPVPSSPPLSSPELRASWKVSSTSSSSNTLLLPPVAPGAPLLCTCELAGVCLAELLTLTALDSLRA
mmetsp:Transcript_23275/g.59485  ORF Transcript_23275/g.59485 Transcript_23275/m.59485 type:complete len:325 (-) Transcript_23275:264-1238(-)